MISVFHWGVIFQIYHMIEKIWWWEMITDGLKSPNNLYLEAKNQKWADMEATFITLLCHIKCNIILVFWLILRDHNAVLISLITKKNVYWAIMEANIYVILPPKCTEFPQHLMEKILLRNNSYVTTSLWNANNQGESVLCCANKNIENVWRVRSIHES